MLLLGMLLCNCFHLLSLQSVANRGLSPIQAPTIITSAHLEGAVDSDTSEHDLGENAADVAQPYSHPVEELDVHMMMGAALVIGFVVMLLIDQLGKHNHSHSQHGTGGEWYKAVSAKLRRTSLVHCTGWCNPTRSGPSISVCAPLMW